jgi:phosphomethylpyrimidine synthase
MRLFLFGRQTLTSIDERIAAMSEAHTQNGSQNGHGSTPSTARLTTTPFPASRKVHVEGSQSGVRVPMREISLTATHSTNGNGGMPNQPVTVYDTSGPYTDPNVTIDVRAGLPPLRRAWIEARQDTKNSRR